MGKVALLLHDVRQALNVIPKEYSSDLENKRADTNLVRLMALSIGLILINIFVVIVDWKMHFPSWEVNQSYEHLLHAHVWLILERGIFMALIWFIKAKNVKCSIRCKNIIVLYSCIISLLWFTYSDINAHDIYGYSYAYLIGSFFVASAILLLPKESIFVFTINFIAFVYLQFVKDNDSLYLGSNIINAAFVFIFLLIISLINIFQYFKDYKYNIIIRSQAKELISSRDKLEDTVKLRTEELVRANEQLIKEIGVRHEIEMQSIKTKLMYEENTMLLKEIKEYEELRNVFFANLSHELRTPLNVIFSAQQMMNYVINKQEPCSYKDQLTRYNKIVKQNCYRLIRLIGNLIDITKIDAKYFELSKKNCDIVKLVENITQSVADYIKDKSIELIFDTEVEEKIIACDPDKIERIMLNLLSNAVKFTSENGIICVNMRLVEGYVVIAIKDNGIGISQEMQQVVFERFIQVDKSMTRNREGSGIGLSLVKSLVDLHQGKINLISEEGKGSEFVVELPDLLIPFEDCIACTSEDNVDNIERINIEFSDIYS